MLLGMFCISGYYFRNTAALVMRLRSFLASFDSAGIEILAVAFEVEVGSERLVFFLGFFFEAWPDREGSGTTLLIDFASTAIFIFALAVLSIAFSVRTLPRLCRSASTCSSSMSLV